jgi:deazaflavin-dependent oxidoreductase (nitroreductase family)
VVKLLLDPTAHGVVASREVPGVVRVEAFHAHASTAYTTRGARSCVLGGERGIAFGRVARVGRGEKVLIDFGFRAPDSGVGLETADRVTVGPTHEPVAGGHRGSVVEEWCIADHDGHAGLVAHDDIERAARCPSKQVFDNRSVVHDGETRQPMALPDYWRDHPFTYLTTTGRRSGKAHRIEIWFVLDDGSAWLLTERSPETDWVANLRADPKVILEIGDSRTVALAEVVEIEREHDVRRALAERYALGDRELREWAQGALAVRVTPV